MAGEARAFEIPGFELVYTPPAETTLVNRDLRRPNVVWMQLFRSAKRTIDIEQMYTVSAEGEPMEGVLDALEEAGTRGVRIRMILEKKMLRASEPSTIERIKKIPNLELQIMDFGKVTGRDAIIHAKYLVVDGLAAYVGSQNFDWRSLKHVHELGVRVDDEAIVRQMQAVFDMDWASQKDQGRKDRKEKAVEQATAKKIAGTDTANNTSHIYLKGHSKETPSGKVFVVDSVSLEALKAGRSALEVAPPAPSPLDPAERPDPAPPPPVRLVASPPDRLPPGVGWSQDELVRLLGSAQKEIRAQVMSYSPTSHGKGEYKVIDDALRAAAKRGVKVRLLVANWSTGKPAIDHLKALSQVPGVEIKVVTIPEAKEGFIPFARVIHSKFCAVDGRTAWIGTSNWEGGYLDRLRNLELVFDVPAMAERVGKLHEQLWTSSYAEAIDVDKDYPKVKRE